MPAGRLLMRAFGLHARSHRHELMDSVALPPEVADRVLRFLELTNRRFGGTSLVLRHLERWWMLSAPGRAVTVLDVGTGAADIPRRLVRWGGARGTPIRVTAIDMAPDIAAAARARVRDEPDIDVEQATLAEVAASGRRFDYVIGSLFLHHVPAAELHETLRAIDRLAVRGVILGDLARGPAALLAVGFLSVVAGNRIVRHDAPLSVRRAFTVAELSALAADLDLGYLRARPEGPFRLSLAGEKEAHA
jgi:2-polyprenyl-3-methyl-5-hydroxy-6-metoxy-1,4-benzoquinol methylase